MGVGVVLDCSRALHWLLDQQQLGCGLQIITSSPAGSAHLLFSSSRRKCFAIRLSGKVSGSNFSGTSYCSIPNLFHLTCALSSSVFGNILFAFNHLYATHYNKFPRIILDILHLSIPYITHLTQSLVCRESNKNYAPLLQVLGHVKTVLVILGGWLFFGDRVTALQIAGILIAVLGMVLYGDFTR